MVSQQVMKNTFIIPRLLPLTREFTKEEIAYWEKEDKLTCPKKIFTPKMFFNYLDKRELKFHN